MILATDTACVLQSVANEVVRARGLFPNNKYQHAALAEEVGEIAKALMDLELGKETYEGFRTECIQAAAMCVRLATEGDKTFPASLPRG